MQAMNRPITNLIAPQDSAFTLDAAAAYEYCRELTYLHAKTFYFASHFIPKCKRNACYAVYAFCRYVDDLIDVAMENGDVTPGDARQIVEQWNSAIQNVYNGHAANHPIVVAWEDTLRHYKIPRSLPVELIEGVLMDTTVSRFETFDELREYCYKVASVVGLMTSEIFGYSSAMALDHAVDLGIAMQLTNIIRDVREDAGKGRIYLPQSELRRFGVQEADILALRHTEQLQDLIKELVRLAESYYHRADKGIAYLEKNSRLTVTLMSSNYRGILGEIRRQDYNVMQKRASTSLAQKVLSIPTSWVSVHWNAATQRQRRTAQL
ncbi:phytoene/squalene synthase family protein [soil metagenome]